VPVLMSSKKKSVGMSLDTKTMYRYRTVQDWDVTGQEKEKFCVATMVVVAFP